MHMASYKSDRTQASREHSPRGGGGHSGTEWLPNTKWLHGAKAMNTKRKGWSTPLEGLMAGRSTSNKEPTKDNNLEDVVMFTLFHRIHDAHNMKCFIEELHFCISFCIEKV